MTLTDNGLRCLPLMRELIAAESNLYETASDIKGLATGSVTLAAYPSIATYWLPRVIREFEGLYPHIQIHLMEGVRQEICAWLDDRRADLAFFTYMEGMEYDWLPLAEDPMIAVLPADHPLAENDAYPLDRTNQEQFIMPALGHDDDVIALFQRNHLSPTIRFSTFENGAVLSLIEQGLGMSIMNRLCTRSWDFDVRIRPLDPPQSVTFGMASLPETKASPAVRRFMDYAASALKDIDDR